MLVVDIYYVYDIQINDYWIQALGNMICWSGFDELQRRLVCYCHRKVGNSTRKPFELFSCERRGEYKLYKEVLTRKSIDTKEKNVICEILLDHAYVDHLNSKKKILLNEMTKIMMKSCKISLTIKSQDEDNVNSIKIIYNAWQKFRHQQRGSMKCNIEAVIRYIVVDYILSFF